MNQRFTLDQSSFERLLAAAWVLQCLHDQLHGPQVDREETMAEPGKTQMEMETTNPRLQVAMKPVLRFSPKVTEAHSKHDAPVETGMLNFDAAVNIELKTPEHKSLPSEGKATPSVRSPLPVSVNLTKRDNKEWARRGSAFNLRTAFNRAHDAFSNLLPRVRVNLPWRGLRAVAIATPVWLLSLVAALLFLQVWRHASFPSAEATSMPNPPAVEAVVGNASTTLTTTKQPVSEEVKSTDKEPRRSAESPPLEDSHRRITDPATMSAVQQLSRYEIKGLRRQANYGDDSAAFALGMAYEVGHSVPQNCVEAARWVTMAAEAGDAAAQYNLGLRYRAGDGVPVNRAASERWLRQAAAHRNQQAKLALKILASR